MTDEDVYNARVTAANLYLQDRSRTPEEWFDYLTTGQPNAEVLTLTSDEWRDRIALHIADHERLQACHTDEDPA